MAKPIKRGLRLFPDDLITAFSLRDPIKFCPNNGYLEEDHRMIISRGNNWSVLVVSGYLRQHCINPADISKIIAKFISCIDNCNQNNINTLNFSVCNDHEDILVLFPGMSQISIQFSQLYKDNHGCNVLGCTKLNSFHCGIIGFPNPLWNSTVHVTPTSTIRNENLNDKPLQSKYNHQRFINYNYNNVKPPTNYGWSITKFYQKMHILSGVPTLIHENLNIKNVRRLFGIATLVKCEIIDCCITCNDQNWDLDGKIDPKNIRVTHRVTHYGESMNCKQDTGYIKSDDSIDIFKDGFSFKQGDKIVMKHSIDKNNNLNLFTITVCGKVGYKNDELDVQTLVKEKMIYKADLKECYDYVIVCCVYGCNTRDSGKQNIFRITSQQ